MGNRNLLAVALAALTILIIGALLGTVVGSADDSEQLGSLPTEIAGERIEPVPPAPASAGVPPLRTTTTSAPVQSVVEEAESESVYAPESEYVPTTEEEKTPYVPPTSSGPPPEVTVGKNE